MNLDIIFDMLNIIADRTQSQIEKIVRKNKSVTQKLRYVSLVLGECKTQIYEWIDGVLNSGHDLKKLRTKLVQLNKSNSEQLARHRLHIYLKKKLNKLKKQSFLHSLESSDHFFQEQNKIHDLQKSILHIQKDLNIEQQGQEQFNISSIIERSRMTLHQNYKESHNTSVISQYTSLNLSIENRDFHHQSDLPMPDQSKNNSYKQNGGLPFLKDQAQLRPQKTQLQQSQQGQYSQQGQQSQWLKTNSKTQDSSKQNSNQNIANLKLQTKRQTDTLDASSQKVMKKKKKNIYTNPGTNNLSKDDLFGNLLQQSYQSCIQTSKR